MRAYISDDVVFRVEKLTGKPVFHSFDKSLAILLNNYEKLKRKRT